MSKLLLKDYATHGPSPVVEAFASVARDEASDLDFAFHVRQLLVALDSPFAFHRAGALARLFRLIRDLPPPRSSDPFAALAREAATGRHGSAPSLVSNVLKRTFRTVVQTDAAERGNVIARGIEQDVTGALDPVGLHAAPGGPEMELALRVCQGVCILSPSQRKLAEDSALVEIVAAVLDALALPPARSSAAASPAVASPLTPPLHRDVTTAFTDGAATPPPQGTSIPSTSPGRESRHVSGSMQHAITQTRYRVALAALDAFEAVAHFAPDVMVRAIRKGVIRRVIATFAEPAHPQIVREAAADVMGSVYVQTCNHGDWADGQTSTALANEIKGQFRAILDRRREARAARPDGVEPTAAQLLDMLGRLRDFRGLAAFHELAAPMASPWGDAGLSPSRRGRQPAAKEVGVRTVAAARDAETALLKLQTARRARFDEFLDVARLPDTP